MHVIYSKDVTIANNRFYNNEGSILTLSEAKGVILANNTIINNTCGEFVTGCLFKLDSNSQLTS